MLVVEIFSFTLEKVERDGMEVLKDEFKALKKVSEELDQEVAMFNYQFFSHSWSEQGRKQTIATDQTRREIVETMANSFDQFQVFGYHQ